MIVAWKLQSIQMIEAIPVIRSDNERAVRIRLADRLQQAGQHRLPLVVAQGSPRFCQEGICSIATPYNRPINVAAALLGVPRPAQLPALSHTGISVISHATLYEHGNMTIPGHTIRRPRINC
jgi:hypothetical protein